MVDSVMQDDQLLAGSSAYNIAFLMRTLHWLEWERPRSAPRTTPTPCPCPLSKCQVAGHRWVHRKHGAGRGYRPLAQLMESRGAGLRPTLFEASRPLEDWDTLIEDNVAARNFFSTRC